MKKSIIAFLSVLAFTSCSHDLDFSPSPEQQAIKEKEIKENAQKVFGVTFDPNQDWCTTVSGKVTIQANASVKKVQVLTELREIYGDCEWYVTQNSLRKLNEAETNGRTTITLNYNAPKDNLGFYVAFYTEDGGFYVKKVENNTASIYDVLPARTRALSTGYVLPTDEFKIATIEDSYAAQRAEASSTKAIWASWSGEKLYSLSDEDYSKLKMFSTDMPDYSDATKASLKAVLDETFPNGRTINGQRINNLEKLKALGQENGTSDPITTGKEPIIVTPLYKFDHPVDYGNEVYNSDLYYYYYDENDAAYQEDPIAYLKSLPKFKAIPFNQVFEKDGDDDTVKKYGSFALLYFGEGVPTTETVGKFEFPAGLKIGLMVRAKTTYEAPKKNGEVYLDGRLNNQINTWGNFASSGFKAGDNTPRAAWLQFNKKAILCWESGTDADYNDIMLEFEGGIDGPTPPPPFDDNVYTFCFEDTEMGDYDMNDVVIKAKRIDETTVQYSIVACGAYDAVYVRNINDELDNIEVHSLFVENPTTTKFFINTNPNDKYYTPYTITVNVSEDFDFLTVPEEDQIYIHDGTTNVDIRLAKKGQDPHAIMIPYDMKYPKEQVCIKDAFTLFNNWGQNAITDTYWYMSPEMDKVYTKTE